MAYTSSSGFQVVCTSGTGSSSSFATGAEIATRNDNTQSVSFDWYSRNSSDTAVLPILRWITIGNGLI